MNKVERDNLLKVRSKIFDYVITNHPDNDKFEECVIEVTECFPGMIKYEDDAFNIIIDLYSSSFNTEGLCVVHTFCGNTFGETIKKMDGWINRIIADGIPDEGNEIFHDDDDE